MARSLERPRQRRARQTGAALKIPHDVIVLRSFIYDIGDRSWTDAERGHVLDLMRAIWRRRTTKRKR